MKNTIHNQETLIISCQENIQSINIMSQTQRKAKFEKFVIWFNNSYNDRLEYSVNRIKLTVAKQKVRQMYVSVSKQNQQVLDKKCIDFSLTKDYQTIRISNYASIKQSKYVSIHYPQKADNQNYQSISRNFNIQQLKLSTACREKVETRFIEKQYEKNGSSQNNYLQSWMIRQEQQIVLLENYADSQCCEKKILSYPQPAIQTVRKYKFSTFSKNTVHKPKFYFFKPKDPLKYSSESISTPILCISQDYQELAVDIFDQLLKAAGDQSSQFPVCYHLYNIAEWVIKQNDDIRDEVFFQIIKQLSSLKPVYAQIMCAISTVLKPSMRLYIPLLNYLFEQNMMDHQRKFEKNLNYCFSHLIKNFQNSYSGNPSMYELNCYLNMKKVPITIAFPKQKTFYVESYSLVQQLIEQIIDFYGLDPQIDLLLYLGGVLLQKGRLLDEYAKSVQRNEQNAYQQYKKFRGFRGIIVLKNMMRIRQSSRSFNLMYNYMVVQYRRGLFGLRSAEMVQIGGLILYCETNSPQSAIFELQRLLPARKVKQLYSEQQDQQTTAKREKFKKYIIKNYYKYEGYSKYEARKKVVRLFQDSRAFLTHLFLCKVSYNQGEQYQARVGLKWNKMIILDIYQGRLLREIVYTNISDWGATNSEICWKIDQIGQLNCYSSQAKIMASIFQQYLEYGLKQAIQ